LFVLFLTDAIRCVIFLLSLRNVGNGAFPKPLSPDEEKALVIEKCGGDTTAREKLIEHNLRLVVHIVKKYCNSQTDQDDLISIGTIGLIKAVDTFNTLKCVKLATYASRCIENEILMHFRSLKRYCMEVSLDEPIDIDKDGNPLSLFEIICIDDNIVDEIEQSITYQKLKDIVRYELPERERQIIEMRYALSESFAPLTQAQVAEKLNISRSYVSRLEKKAVEFLGERLKR